MRAAAIEREAERPRAAEGFIAGDHQRLIAAQSHRRTEGGRGAYVAAAAESHVTFEVTFSLPPVQLNASGTPSKFSAAALIVPAAKIHAVPGVCNDFERAGDGEHARATDVQDARAAGQPTGRMPPTVQ